MYLQYTMLRNLNQVLSLLCTPFCKNYSIIFKGFRIADSCAKLRFARLAGTAAHCARFREAKFCATGLYL